jgi:hypothetical protein
LLVEMGGQGLRTGPSHAAGWPKRQLFVATSGIAM